MVNGMMSVEMVGDGRLCNILEVVDMSWFCSMMGRMRCDYDTSMELGRYSMRSCLSECELVHA